MAYILISWLTFRNRIREELRYPFQFVLNTLGFVVVGFLLSMGSVALVGDGDISTNMAAFFTAFLAGAAFGLPGDTLTENRQRLQEVYLRPLPSIWYILSVSLGRGLEMVLTLGLLIFAVSVAGRADSTVVIRMVAVSGAVFLSMLGLGFVLAGLRLVFQKLGSLAQLLSLAFIGAALATPPELLARTASWSPFGAGLLYIRDGQLVLVPMLIATTIYLVLGMAAFRLGERMMFSRGLMNVE